MKESKDIKWVALQPLTGGMYLGFENILGCPASCIISYRGLNDRRPSKEEGNRGRCGNEFNLTEYLRQKGRPVPRYEFQHGMFDMEEDWRFVPDLYTDLEFPDLENIDIVCAVPVCSGLSALTATDADDKEKKNCNMKFLTKFALEVIKPKAYIFENAPMFMSGRGNSLRKWFEDLAWENHYRIAYFRTDTKFHHNAQRRPRTFVMFLKDAGNAHSRFPKLENIWEHDTLTISEVFNTIPKDAPQMDSFPIPLFENDVFITWAKETVGENWRDWFTGDVMNRIIRENRLDEFENWCKTTTKVKPDFLRRMLKHIDHIRECLSEGHGWWSSCPKYYPTLAPSIQARTMYATIHPTEDRLCSEREMMTLMGMPFDFEIQANFMSAGPKIGQNVPVKTAEWIARVALQALEKDEDYCEVADDPHTSPRFYDNVEMKEVEYK